MTSETTNDARTRQFMRERQIKDQQALLEILKGILQALGFGENANMTDFAEDVTEEEITRHPVFLSEHPRYTQSVGVQPPQTQTPIIFSQGQAASRQTLFTNEQYGDAALRAALSIGIERYTENSIARGVKYGFGVKDGDKSIDCSGFVQQAIKRMVGGKEGFTDVNLTAMFANHSDGQIAALAQKTNFLLQGSQINMSTMKAGMIIGIDSGDKGWDRGRSARGIDHIGIVYADTETGKLMFAESRGGKGAMATPLDEWLKTANDKNYKLFAADAVKLASEDYKQRLQNSLDKPKLQTADAATTTRPNAPTSSAGINPVG